MRLRKFFCSILLASISLFAEEESFDSMSWPFKKAKENPFSKDIPIWMHEQIQSDLAPFACSGITKNALDDFMDNHGRDWDHYGLVRFTIQNRQVRSQYFPTENPIVIGRIAYLTEAFHRLAAMTELPDVDFILTVRDSLWGVHLPIPVFAFANDPTVSKNVILMPDFEALSGNEGVLAEADIGSELYPWESKRNQAIWRGAMTGSLLQQAGASLIVENTFTLENFRDFSRTQAIDLSLQFPSLINARYTTLSQCVECQEIQSRYAQYFDQFMPIREQLLYKYQLLIDGNTTAYSRAFWQLFSNSVVFKQKSNSIQWYYRALQPWVHYVPLLEDLSDLPEMIHWAMNHDDQVKQISEQAQNFAKNHLTHFRVLQYLYLLFAAYSKLQL